MPKVSICIPAYNQANLLKKTIDSVLVQTFNDYEIIITDDSSNNFVKDLVSSFNTTDKIKYFRNKIPLGSPENWNEGIRNAKGDYIKILHHDDRFFDKNSLAKYVALLDENPKIDFAFSATINEFSDEERREHLITTEQLNELRNNSLLLFCNNIIGAPSNTILRKNSKLIFDNRLKWLVDIEFYIGSLTNDKGFVYTSEMLSVTHNGSERVTNTCEGNIKVEIFEYFYVFWKIYSQRKNYKKEALVKCINKIISICNQYNITSLKEVKDIGYSGNIPYHIKVYLFTKRLNPFLSKLFLAILRRNLLF